MEKEEDEDKWYELYRQTFKNVRIQDDLINVTPVFDFIYLVCW